MRQFRITVLIGIMFIFSLGFSQEHSFLFVKMVDDIPYILYDDPHGLARVQSLLINSLLDTNRFWNVPTLNLNMNEIERLHGFQLHWDGATITNYCNIAGPREQFTQSLGFAPNDEFIMQNISEDCSSKRRIASIDKVLYYWHNVPSFYSNLSDVLFKCKPVNLDSSWEYIDHFTTAFIAYKHFSQDIGTDKSTIEYKIPELIEGKIDSMDKRFCTESSFKDNMKISVQPFYSQDLKSKYKKETLYYAVVVSCSDDIFKVVIGNVYVLNGEGTIVAKIEGKDFNGISGITDVDCNGFHEVIIKRGSHYGGGIEVYQLQRFEQKIRLRKEAALSTIFD